MTTAGLGLSKICLHPETTPPCLVAHLLARHKHVERNWLIPGPQPSRRTKVRDAAFGRNSRPGKRADHGGTVNEIPHPSDCGGKIGRDHCVYWVPYQPVRFSLCDICTLCSAYVISMRRSIFIATSL